MADAIMNHKSAEKGDANSNGVTSNGATSNGNASTESPKKKKPKVNGRKQIGLSHEDIKRVIECMPNAAKCQNYKFQFRRHVRKAEEEGWTPQKIFKRSLRKKSSSSSPKKKSSTPKKSKFKNKKKKPTPTKVVNQTTNISQTFIVNTINTTNHIVA